MQFNVGGRVKAWKVKEITHDLNHDLTFYCTHNQLCVPQYKVNALGIYNFGFNMTLNEWKLIASQNFDRDSMTLVLVPSC